MCKPQHRIKGPSWLCRDSFARFSWALIPRTQQAAHAHTSPPPHSFSLSSKTLPHLFILSNLPQRVSPLGSLSSLFQSYFLFQGSTAPLFLSESHLSHGFVYLWSLLFPCLSSSNPHPQLCYGVLEVRPSCHSSVSLEHSPGPASHRKVWKILKEQ